MKGIILAGGTGERLYPMTGAVSKQLLPVYDKPMIYYPLSVLLSIGIREILIITTPRDRESFRRLLGDGAQIGADFTYAVQETPKGLAEAFLIGETFIGADDVALILGDNLFYGMDLIREAPEISGKLSGAVILGHKVKEPSKYGVIQVDRQGHPVSIEEKPEMPRSEYAVPGLYFYDHSVVEIAKKIRPSQRGELEITDVNAAYLAGQNLTVRFLRNGAVWMDAGTPESLLEASNFVAAFWHRHGVQIGCIEEIAYRQGWIDEKQLSQLAWKYGKTDYGRYLSRLAERGRTEWE